MDVNKNKTFSIPLYAIFFIAIYATKLSSETSVIKKEKNENFMPMI